MLRPQTRTAFVILGLWLEDEAFGADEAFAEVLARAFAPFMMFLGTRALDVTPIREPLLRQRVSRWRKGGIS